MSRTRSEPRHTVTVTIAGERHVLRSDAPPEYTQAVAQHVDATVRALGDAQPLQAHRSAILAALFITDELFRARRRIERLEHEFEARAARLAERLESALQPSLSDEPAQDGAPEVAERAGAGVGHDARAEAGLEVEDREEQAPLDEAGEEAAPPEEQGGARAAAEADADTPLAAMEEQVHAGEAEPTAAEDAGRERRSEPEEEPRLPPRPKRSPQLELDAAVGAWPAPRAAGMAADAEQPPAPPAEDAPPAAAERREPDADAGGDAADAAADDADDADDGPQRSLL